MTDLISGLTMDELIISEHLVEAWNGFCKLDKQHPNENTDFMNGIHQLQNILGMRIVRREYSNYWPVKINL